MSEHETRDVPPEEILELIKQVPLTKTEVAQMALELTLCGKLTKHQKDLVLLACALKNGYVKEGLPTKENKYSHKIIVEDG